MAEENQSKHTTISEITRLVESCPRRRYSYQEVPEDTDAFVVSGPPKAWSQATDFLLEHDKKVVAYHDVNGREKRESIDGRPVLRAANLGRFGDVPRLFAGAPMKGWFSYARPGLQECIWHIPPRKWQQTGYHQPGVLEEHREAIIELYSMLADERSRRVFASLLRARMEGDVGFTEVAPFLEYDHRIVGAQEGDIVIDAGAYVGDTAQMYSQRVGATGRVLSLEPSYASYMALVKTAHSLPHANVIPICYGLWNEPDILSFDEEKPGAASFAISDSGKSRIPVTTLDQLVALYQLPAVDLVKLDVEGAEAKALDGAKETLQRFRPKIQMSIYHKPNDLFELPARLAAMLPDYRFYLGHHSFYHMETDLYGIPVERIPWHADMIDLEVIGSRVKRLLSEGRSTVETRVQDAIKAIRGRRKSGR